MTRFWIGKQLYQAPGALFCRCNNAQPVIYQFSPEQKSIFFSVLKKGNIISSSRAAQLPMISLLRSITASVIHWDCTQDCCFTYTWDKLLITESFAQWRKSFGVCWMSLHRDDPKTHPVRSKQPLLHLRTIVFGFLFITHVCCSQTQDFIHPPCVFLSEKGKICIKNQLTGKELLEYTKNKPKHFSEKISWAPEGNLIQIEIWLSSS